MTVTAELLDRYRRTVESFRGALAAACNRLGIAFLPATSDTRLDRLVLNLLKTGGMKTVRG